MINSLLPTEKANIRLLDLGCGNGHALRYIAEAFAVLRPNLNLEFYGLDIYEMTLTRDYLNAHVPGRPWDSAIVQREPREAWPWQDCYFDVIVSNQVLEHVMDMDTALVSLHRCLTPDGFSINLFPLKESIIEPHAFMPLVHRVKNEGRRAALMGAFTRMGLKKAYRIETSRRGLTSIDDFAATFSHVLTTDTNYLDLSQFTALTAKHGLKASFSYTSHYFGAKAASLLKRRTYAYQQPGIAARLLVPICIRLASATAVLTKM
ncbi:MAG: class I SAM-dependent methyltransferase [Rhizomicrobium sp.]